jgi:glycosyltransferase involved in cell wall biosynthesis
MVEKSVRNIWIVIPVFNESKVIKRIIKSIQKEGFNNIIIVDDGSIDDTYAKAKGTDSIVIRHIINRGKGAATQTGLDAAKILNSEIVVTMDGDGQHSASDIKKLIEPIINGKCDVTLGSRLLNKKVMPVSRRFINIIGNIITYLFYGIYVTDSQSGFRAYSKKANEIINTTMDRYEFESEILQQIKWAGLKYKEVPITVEYTDYSKNKYKYIKDFERQKFTNGFKMLFRMIIKTIF